MNINFIKNKIKKPLKDKNNFLRQSINQFFQANKAKKVFFISSPNGYGKTSSVLNYISNDKNNCWFSCSGEDNSFKTFFQYIIFSIRESKKNFCERLINNIFSEDISNVTIINIIINELNILKGSINLVIDDYQNIDEQEIHNSVIKLIEYTSSLKIFIISSNSRISDKFNILFNELKIKDQLCEINFNVLKLNKSDIINISKELNISPERINELENKSFGNILIFKNLIKLEIDTEYITESDIYNYVENNFFNNFSSDFKLFIDSIIDLPIISYDLCLKILGISQEKFNLYINNLYEKGLIEFKISNHVKYYYFNDLMKSNYLRNKIYDVKKLKEVCLWYLEQNFISYSINIFYTFKDDTFFVLHFQNIFYKNINTDQLRVYDYLFEEIPLEKILKSEKLTVYYLWLLHKNLEMDKIDFIIENLKFRTDKFRNTNLILTEHCYILKGFIYYHQKKMNNFLEIFFQRLNTIESGEDLFLKSKVYYLLCWYYYYYEKKCDICLYYVNKAIEIVPRNKRDYFYFSMIKYLTLYKKGYLNEAESGLENLELNIKKNKLFYPYLSINIYSKLIEIKNHLNKIDQANEYFYKFKNDLQLNYFIENNSKNAIKISYYTNLLSASLTLKNYADIYSIKEIIWSLSSGSKILEEAYLNNEAYLYLKLDQLSNLKEWINNYNKLKIDISSENISKNLIFLEYLIISKEYNESLIIVAQILSKIDLVNHFENHLQVLFLRSYIFYQLDNLKDANINMVAALKLAQPYGFIKIFSNTNFGLFNLLESIYQKVITKKITGLKTSYLEKIILSFDKNLIEDSSINLTKREKEIIELIEKSYSNKDISNKLYLSINTVKSHIGRIMKKLNCKNRDEIILLSRK